MRREDLPEVGEAVRRVGHRGADGSIQDRRPGEPERPAAPGEPKRQAGARRRIRRRVRRRIAAGAVLPLLLIAGGVLGYAGTATGGASWSIPEPAQASSSRFPGSTRSPSARAISRHSSSARRFRSAPTASL